MDINEIPKIQMDILSRTLLAEIRRRFEIPGADKEFEEWKARKEQAQRSSA